MASQIKWSNGSNFSYLIDTIDGRVSFLALSGVPQGTVLGPISFLINTCVLTSPIRSFTDDTRVCKAVSLCQDVSDLQKDLGHIITWSDCNNMMLHEDKFAYICHQANRSNLLHQLPFTSTYFEYHTLGGITLHPANNIRGTVCPRAQFSAKSQYFSSKSLFSI